METDDKREFLRRFYLQRFQVGLGVDPRGRRIEMTRSDLYTAVLLLREYGQKTLKEMTVRFFRDHPRDTTLERFFYMRRELEEEVLKLMPQTCCPFAADR